jgi:hypothetical protein
MYENTVKSHWNERWAKVETPTPTKSCDYFISDYGRIKSVIKKSGKENLLKGSIVTGGFRSLHLRLINKGRYSLYVHKFVAEHFIPNEDEDKTFVIHKDLNKLNNYWENLQWVDREELTQWQIDNGVYDPNNKKRGSHTKLTESKVKLILHRIKKGKTKKKLIAKQMGISYMQLNRVERGENWGYVTLDDGDIENK